MRTSEIKDKIVDRIQAITPTGRASSRDVFRHIDHAARFGLQTQAQGRFPDRSFHVTISTVPTRADMLTTDAYQAEFTIGVFYNAGQQFIEDRITQDAEAIDFALVLTHQDSAALFNVPVAPQGVEEFESVILMELRARCLYRLTGV